MITLLALSTLSLAAVAEEPTPITAAMVEIVIGDPATGTPMCDAYGGVMAIVDGFVTNDADRQVWVDVADAYAIVSLEGDALRLDNGARGALTDWLHTSCS